MTHSSHGILTRGVGRAVLGLARSFLFMGDDGLLAKRYLLRDPYNVVTLGDLVASSLWKMALFYLTMLALVAGLLTTADGRRCLLLGAVAAVPVVGFGILWQGGDMERYLPLYPFLFLALAGLWSSDAGPFWKLLPAGFFLLALVVNGTAYARWVVGAHRLHLTSRLAGLHKQLPPGSQIVVARDPLLFLPRDFPLHQTRRVPISPVLVPGLADSLRWRHDFALRVERTWKRGGEVWLSRRLLEDSPRPDSTWAEGDDPRLKWADVPAFFRPFATDDEVGGDDGFVRLARTPANEALLARTATP
jgi:hypothetical protein